MNIKVNKQFRINILLNHIKFAKIKSLLKKMGR